MLVLLQLVTTAAVPFSETVLLPCALPKFVHVIVTAMPTGPEVGATLLIVGAWPQLISGARSMPTSSSNSTSHRARGQLTNTFTRLTGLIALSSANPEIGHLSEL